MAKPQRSLGKSNTNKDLAVHLDNSVRAHIYINVKPSSQVSESSAESSQPKESVDEPVDGSLEKNDEEPEKKIKELKAELSQLKEEQNRQRQNFQHENGELMEKHKKECEKYQEENRHLRCKLKSQQDRLVQQQQQNAELEEQLEDERSQKQQLQAQVDVAIACLKGEASTPEVNTISWEIPESSIEVSNKFLGTGAWGYVAEGIFHGQKVAVKCLHRNILSPFTTSHVQREISIMAKVRHPNLILFIGAVLNAHTGPLIITELLDRTLRSAYEEKLFYDHCKLQALRDVACALSYLHSQHPPIIHRDVSSANVLLEALRGDKWKAKLADFGSANLVHLATTPGEGSLVYAAPEACIQDRSRQTTKVDVYSFGVLVCEVSLCKFPPTPDQFSTFLGHLRANQLVYMMADDCTKLNQIERPTMREIFLRIKELIDCTEF